MAKIEITLDAGRSTTLLTKGKLCDKNIVVTAGDNYDAGFTAGYENGEEDGYTDGFNDGTNYGYKMGKDDGYSDGKIEGIEQGLTQGIADGKQQAYDEFWDAFQDNGTKTNYVNAFSGSGWKDTNYNPKYPINATNHAGGIFTYCSQITSTKVPIIIDNIAANTMVFFSCSSLKTIPSLKVTDQVKSYSDWFYNCKALEEINFTEDSVIKVNISFPASPLLTTASVNSIIHALKDLTGATAQTLTFHATVGGKLTEEQKAAITAKNWILVY